MTLLNLYVPSNFSPDMTIYNLLFHQLSKIHINSTIVKLFKDEMEFINDILAINIHLAFIIEKHPSIDEIIIALTKLRTIMKVVSKELRKVQRSNNTATVKNIYLNELQNAYGIFILELNALIKKTEQEIGNAKISSDAFEELVNAAYKGHTPNPSPKNSVVMVAPQPEGLNCCGLCSRGSTKRISPEESVSQDIIMNAWKAVNAGNKQYTK